MNTRSKYQSRFRGGRDYLTGNLAVGRSPAMGLAKAAAAINLYRMGGDQEMADALGVGDYFRMFTENESE